MDKTDTIINIKKTYSLDDMFCLLDKIKDINILVVGDCIIDEYQYGVTLGKSGKSPIVAFQEEKKEIYEGGILAIYNHLKDFCNVECFTGNKKIIKRRYIDNNQKIFETYRYKDNNKYIDISKPISEYDMVLIADFGHGFIDKKLQETLESESKYIALNTQLNAGNMGMNTINKYTHRNYISIDFIELRLAFSNQFDSIEDIIKSKFHHETVSITAGREGVFLYRNNELTHVPALAENVVDAIGAGDAYLSITSPLAYIKASLPIIGLIGNVAGAIACTYSGNSEYMTRKKIKGFLEDLYGKDN